MSENYRINRTLARRMVSRRGMIALAGLGAAALAACGGDKKTSPATGETAAQATAATGSTVKRGGTLKLGTLEFPPGLDPDYTASRYHVQRVAFDGLLDFDDKGIAGPTTSSLATKLETPDGTTLVLQLRQGVRFHDGTDFNAEAVNWNFKRTMANNPPGSVFRVQLLSVDRVEVVDPSTVRYTLKQPDASITAALADTGSTMKSPTAYEGKAVEQVRWAPVGTGLYQFKSVSQDASVSFVPFPEHFHKLADGKSAALLDELRLVSLKDEVVIAAALESGDVDMIEESPGSQLAVLEANANLQATQFQGYSVQQLYINHGLPPMDNVNFRRALLWALDREAFNKLFFAGRGKLATSILSSASWAHIDVKGFPTFDPDKAKMLVEQSGIPTAERKVLVTSAAGETPQFQFIQASWREIGVTAEFVSAEQATGRLNKNRGDKGDIHGSISDITSKFDPSLQLSPQLRKDGIYNYGAASTGEAEALLLKALSTYDVEERKRLYAQLQELQVDQLYSALSWVETPFWLHGKKNIVGMGFFPNGRGDYRYLGYA